MTHAQFLLTSTLFSVCLAAIAYALVLARAVLRTRARPSFEGLLLGAVVSFFDTLGIGSFAPATAWMRLRGLVPDRLIPPNLVVGLTAPSIAQSLIFLPTLGVSVEPVLLVGSAMATLAGGLVGAPLVARAKVWVVQLVVAFALLLAAVAYAMANLHLFPAGGNAAGLPAGLTLIAIGAGFFFGLLANFGVGNYAPTLVMLSLMGMDPRLCFPIMATGGSLMGTGASIRHIAVAEIDLRIVLGLAIGGIPAALLAALVVRSMPIEWLRWLVLAVVLYACATMAAAAARGEGGIVVTREPAEVS